MTAVAHRVEDPPARVVVRVSMLPLEVGEPVLVGERLRLRERPGAVARDERMRELRLVVPRQHRLEREVVDGILACGDQVQRAAHHRRLHDLAAVDGALQRRAPKSFDARPEPDVRRRRPLRLHPGEPLDRGQHADPLPLEKQLSRERRAVQLPQRQDPFHATRLNETDAPSTTAKCARPSSDLPTAPGLT